MSVIGNTIMPDAAQAVAGMAHWMPGDTKADLIDSLLDGWMNDPPPLDYLVNLAASGRGISPAEYTERIRAGTI